MPHNSTNLQAGISCFAVQESSTFEVQCPKVEDAVVKNPYVS